MDTRSTTLRLLPTDTHDEASTPGPSPGLGIAVGFGYACAAALSMFAYATVLAGEKASTMEWGVITLVVGVAGAVGAVMGVRALASDIGARSRWLRAVAAAQVAYAVAGIIVVGPVVFAIGDSQSVLTNAAGALALLVYLEGFLGLPFTLLALAATWLVRFAQLRRSR